MKKLLVLAICIFAAASCTSTKTCWICTTTTFTGGNKTGEAQNQVCNMTTPEISDYQKDRSENYVNGNGDRVLKRTDCQQQ